MSKSPLQSPYQAFLSLLARYATFLRYCVVGALASGVFYGVANLSALLLKQVDSSPSTPAPSLQVSAAIHKNTAQKSQKVDSRSEAQNLESTFEKTLSSRASEALFLSSRADEVGVAIHKGAKVDSSKDYSASAETMDCHAANAARNDDKKVDSSNNAQTLKQQAQDSSAFTQNAQNLETPQVTNRQPQNASKQAQDSRIFDKNAEILHNNDSTNAARRQDFKTFESNAQNLETPQAAGFCDDFGGFQAVGAGIYLVGNEQAHRAESTKTSEAVGDSRCFFSKSAQNKRSEVSLEKPTPKPSKAESNRDPQHSQTATLLGSLASFLFGYFAQMRLAFRACPNHSTMLPRYLIVLALIALYAQIIAYLGAFFTLSYYLISAFIALSVPLFSYPLQKLWVFAGASKGGGRLSKDSAFGLESWISSPRFVDRPQVLSSLHGLKSHDSISKILESKSGSKSHKTRRSCSFFSKSTASNFTLESTFTQSTDSISKILESTFSLSSRADEVGVAIHTSILESTLTKLDSSISAFLNLIYFTQAHFLAVFFSPFLWLIGLTPRSFVRPLLLAPCNNFSKTNTLFATAEKMDCHASIAARNDGVWEVDCHADFQSARNDRNNATTQKVDSRSKAKPTHHDSKHCGGAGVALRDFGGRARLEVCGCPQNRAINRIAYPRLNRRQRQKHLISFLKESL